MTKPAAGAPVNKGNRKRARKKGVHSFVKGALGAVAVIVVLVVAVLVLREYGIIRFPWDPVPIPNVGGRIMEGAMDVESEQRKASDATVNIKLSARPRFDNGDAEGSLVIVNSAENQCIMRVEIRLNDTDQLIYDSGMMQPNTYIEQDKLAVHLEKGEYPATATVFTYGLENPGEPQSRTSFAQIITILE